MSGCSVKEQLTEIQSVLQIIISKEEGLRKRSGGEDWGKMFYLALD